MLAFRIDPSDPAGALEDCALQLEFVIDAVSQGGTGGVTISDEGAAGLGDLLRAITASLEEVGGIVRQQLADMGTLRGSLAELAVRLTQQPDSVTAAPEGPGAPRDGGTVPGGAYEPAPRLTEPRLPPRQRRAA